MIAHKIYYKNTCTGCKIVESFLKKNIARLIHQIINYYYRQVKYLSMGKEHKKYEFGNKVSIVSTLDGLIVGALSFHNEYDGH